MTFYYVPLWILVYLFYVLKVEFIPKFSVSGIWQSWRESYPEDGTKAEDAISVFTGVSSAFFDTN